MPETIITADQLRPGQQGIITQLCPELDGKIVVKIPDNDGLVVGQGGTTYWKGEAAKRLRVIPVT